MYCYQNTLNAMKNVLKGGLGNYSVNNNSYASDKTSLLIAVDRLPNNNGATVITDVERLCGNINDHALRQNTVELFDGLGVCKRACVNPIVSNRVNLVEDLKGCINSLDRQQSFSGSRNNN
jgi:hypothetical protein